MSIKKIFKSLIHFLTSKRVTNVRVEGLVMHVSYNKGEPQSWMHMGYDWFTFPEMKRVNGIITNLNLDKLFLKHKRFIDENI